jgi:hypothetical protein
VDGERTSEASNSLYSTSSDEHKDFVANVLQRLCARLLAKSRKLFQSHLPGGIYHTPTATQIARAKTCPTHNIGLERLMAKLDRAMQKAPNISQPAAEARIMYADNSVKTWMEEKDPCDQDRLISDARRKGREFSKVQKERKED